MKIIVDKDANTLQKRGYEITIKTMEGDADDYHEFSIHCGMDEAKLRKFIIAAEVLLKTYPNGRGGSDKYEGKYWDLFSGSWAYDSSYGISDSMDEWLVVYHDGNGGVFNCEIVLEAADKAEIDSAPPQDGGTQF